MEWFPNSKVLVTIGNISIHYYAIFIVVGAAIAYFLSKKEMKKTGLNDDQIDDITLGLIFFGFCGARLWYCLLYNPSYYFSNPLRLLRVYEGGLAIQGGLMGAIAFALVYCKIKRYSFFRLADCILPNVLVAQAIGRWGNFINQEAYGQVTSEYNLRFLPEFIKEGMYIDGAYRQPTFLYESLLNIAGFIVIVFIMKKFFKLKRGDCTYFYLMWYGISRFIVEHFRSDSLMIGDLKMAQVLSVIGFIIGLLGYLGVYEHFFKRKKPTVIFDFDGTLVDTSKAIQASFAHVMEDHQLQSVVNDAFNAEILGPAPVSIFKKYAPDLDADELVEQYRQYNWDDQSKYNELFPGAKELLENLKQQGYHMVIVSVKPKEIVEYGLKMFEIDSYFEGIIGHDDVKEIKPDPQGIFKAIDLIKGSKDNAILIGDSASDIKAAQNAGIYSVAYLSYPCKQEALLAAKANDTITNLEEVNHILETVPCFSCDER